MDKAPLVMDEIDSGEAFIKRLHDYAPVKAAWWLRIADDGERYLYVAIDGLDESNADLVYGEVLRITGEMRRPLYRPVPGESGEREGRCRQGDHGHLPPLSHSHPSSLRREGAGRRCHRRGLHLPPTARKVVAANVVGAASESDAHHVALATIARADLICELELQAHCPCG